MLDEVKKLAREDVVIVGLMFAFLFVGVFGAANWNSHISPHVPVMGMGERQETYDAKVRMYEQEVQNVGKDAVIPRVWAIPMTLVGMIGAAWMCGIMVHRYGS